MTAIASEKHTPAVPAQGATPAERGCVTNLQDRARTLFPEPGRGAITRIGLFWCTLAVIAGTAISLGRTAGVGPFQSVGGEDAQPLLTDALNQNALRNIVTPFVGYFHLDARLLTELTKLFPISWAAAVMSVSAALVCALLALTVYMAAGAHFPSRTARLLVSAPLLFSATAENWLSENYNRPATVHFFLAYVLLWMLLWKPSSRSGRITQVALVVLTAFSSFIAVVVFIPLALLRLWALRDRLSLVMAGVLALGGVTHWAGLHFGLTYRWALPRYDPLWAAEHLLSWAVPHSMLGWNFMYDIPGPSITASQVWRIGLAWLLVLAIVVCALRRLTRPNWLLAAAAGAHAGVFITVAVMGNSMITQRYLMTFQMLLFTALVALLVPSDRGSPRFAKLPLMLFTVLVVVVAAVNYRHDRTFRALGPRWTDQIAGARQACADPQIKAAIVRSGPSPYNTLIRVPCHLLTGSDGPCPEQYCATVDPGIPEIRLSGR